MPVRLTESAIKKAIRQVSEGTRTDLADAGCSGLRLRLTPAGSETWVLACRDRQGRMRRFPIGGYPDNEISEARNEARALHIRVKQDGADPVAERRRDRAMGAAARAGSALDLYGEKRGNAQKKPGRGAQADRPDLQAVGGPACGNPNRT
jgi:hypothetical protein